MSSNNEYQKTFEKGAGDEGANGFGIETVDMTGWTGPGSAPSELQLVRQREAQRVSELLSKAGGLTVPITNSGIVLDSFGGMFGEGGAKPNIQGGANK